MSALKTSLVTTASIAFVMATSSPSQSAPLPTNVGMIKSALTSDVAQVRWVGWGGGWRGGGWGYRGGGWGRPWG
jgi:hypothetical protein